MQSRPNQYAPSDHDCLGHGLVQYVCYRYSMAVSAIWLINTKTEGRCPEGEGYISCMARDWHVPQGGRVCALLGSNRQRVVE